MSSLIRNTDNSPLNSTGGIVNTPRVAGTRRFTSFRPNVSADTSNIEIKLVRRIIVPDTGASLSDVEQADVLASYQTSKIHENVSRIVKSVQKFCMNSVELREHYIPEGLETPDERAKSWIKKSLFHALCGVGKSFIHDGTVYHVHNSTDVHTLNGYQVIDFMEGNASISMRSNSKAKPITMESDSGGVPCLIDKSLLADSMKKVIEELHVVIKDGTISIEDKPVIKWLTRPVVKTKAKETNIEDLDIGL